MELVLGDDEETASIRARLLPPRDDASAVNIDNKAPKLPLPLRLLYGLNGVTLSLPMTALLYIVNTRAAIPVAYLSAFGAIAFLPSSLKPLYACMSQYVRRQNALLVILLILSGMSTAATALVPHNGVFSCFVLAFLRGVTSAWPEFILGLSLIRCARQTNDYTLAAAHLQSQAATCRNLGSFTATIVAFLLFLYRHFHVDKDHAELNDIVVTILLVASGLINMVAAVIAWWYRVNDCITESTEVINDGASTLATHAQPQPLCHSLCYGSGLVVVIFQMSIIVFSMQGPIETLTSEALWWFLLFLIMTALVLSVWRNTAQWRRIHRVGLFLIARHAVPDSSFIMESFIYSQLQSTPVVLQALSIVTMGVTTLSSWSYGKLFARCSRGKSLLLVLAGTTVSSSLLSLGYLAIVAEAHDASHHWVFYLIIYSVGIVTTFASEWQFLPDVVLATATVDTEKEAEEEMNSASNNNDKCETEVNSVSEIGERNSSFDPCGRSCNVDSIGIRYSSLISCIDFGDQIGSWLTVPIVAALGISRENDWVGVNEMIVLTAILGLLSVLLLRIVRDEQR